MSNPELRKALKKALNVYEVGDHALLKNFPFRVEVEIVEVLGRDEYRVTGEGGGIMRWSGKGLKR